jgi:hypothetical protein
VLTDKGAVTTSAITGGAKEFGKRVAASGVGRLAE